MSEVVTPDETTKSEESESSIMGPAMLGDIGPIYARIAQMDSDDPVLVNLHSVLYGVPGTKVTRKRDIKIWAGAHGEQVDQLAVGLAVVPTHAIVQAISTLLGITTGENRNATETKICDFLAQPMGPIGFTKRGRKMDTNTLAKRRQVVTDTKKRSRGRPPTHIVRLPPNGTQPLTDIIGHSPSNQDDEQTSTHEIKPSEPQVRKRIRVGRKVYRPATDLPTKVSPTCGFVDFVYKKFPGVLDLWNSLSTDEQADYEPISATHTGVHGAYTNIQGAQTSVHVAQAIS